MKITGIELENIKSYKKLDKLNFSTGINILVGPNNAGKSVIINSIYLIQNPSILNKSDITIGAESCSIKLHFEGSHSPQITNEVLYNRIEFDLIGKRHLRGLHSTHTLEYMPTTEPNNLIYPYLSKRKSVSFDDTINESNANSVSGNFTHLYSKIDRLITPQFQPGNTEYINACKEILGLEISTLAKGAGKQAVLFVNNLEHIPLTAMGEGVTNIIGLITDLCIAENKIFLIEELENDIHPKALKALLKLIESKSSTNQFFISTHSNIVMKHLGSSQNAKVFRVSNDTFDGSRENMRLSTISEASQDPVERKKLLEELGYDFFEYDLWKAWLFLEESSAEIIIRDYLIKWFEPKLKYELRTFSAGSISRIIPKFDDFNKLFVFLHLEPTYKNRVWVYIDAGDNEKSIITKMKDTYSNSGWDKSNFNQFSEHDFEKYYPERFQEEVNSILETPNKKKRQEAKIALLNRVKRWIQEDHKVAKEEFKTSASEIIGILKSIHKQINK